MSNKLEKFATPHDELMALAVAWESDAVFDAQHGQLASATTFEQCAADLRALLDSDAFRAMVRDAERLAWLEGQASNGLRWIARESSTGRGYRLHQTTGAGHATARAAIDAAASGAEEDK